MKNILNYLKGVAGLAVALSLCSCGMKAGSADIAVEAPKAESLGGQADAQVFGRVSFNEDVLMIDGVPTIIWGGEFHPFRLPSVELWRDILQKFKANGYNTVAIYVSWGYHSTEQGVYDFSGVRDIDRLLKMAAEEGLYVVTRAGPYVNAELTRGGFPGWLLKQRARARTDQQEYLDAAFEWLSQINPIIAKNEINNGGSVILHQIENELALTTPSQQRYMQALYTDLYAFDGYPGGTCTVTGKPTRKSAAPDWGFYGAGGARGGASASPTPGFAAEFGGGWFDFWGSNGGYECNAIQRGKRFQRVFYGTNLANGIDIQSFYMTYGGTSWGWMGAPVIYTSYDYGAAFSETREIRPKAQEMKLLGQFIEVNKDLPAMVPARVDRALLQTTNKAVKIYHNKNPQTASRFLLVTHSPSHKRSDDSFSFELDLQGGTYSIPQEGSLELRGFDAKWLSADLDIGRHRLVYSTSELQTIASHEDRDIILFYGRSGEDGELVLKFDQAPQISVIEGKVETSFDEASGDLRFNYKHGEAIRVSVSAPNKPDLLLIIGDEEEAYLWWRNETPQGVVLSRGPNLVRKVVLREEGLELFGDVKGAAALEVFTPTEVQNVEWNGTRLETEPQESGSLRAMSTLQGPGFVKLPSLDWVSKLASPETQIDFDDSDWQRVGGKPMRSTPRPPPGQPNLFMDSYGFHHGDVWYRGKFEGGADAERIKIHYGAGGAGLMQVWLDGEFLGQDETPSGLPRPITMGYADFDLPKSAQSPGEHVLSILVRNNGHNWDLEADDYHKEGRGLFHVDISALEGPSFSVPVSWKIQGSQGGETVPDLLRGVYNNGGLYGERMGWHLPGFKTEAWEAAELEGFPLKSGVTWFRTSFELDFPTNHDVSLGLACADVSKPRSKSRYRTLFFVNGWHMGQMISHIGPQRRFYIPEGVIDHNGQNKIALAVLGDGSEDSFMEGCQLDVMRVVKGGVSQVHPHD